MTRRRSHNCAKTEPSELRCLPAWGIHCPSPGSWLLGVLATLFLLLEPLPSALAQTRGTLIWLKRDLPPLTIFDGPKKGQGVIDQLLPLLIAGMPQYQHSVLAPFIKDGEVDLAELLASGREKLGIIAERNYGEYLDGLLKQAPADSLTSHYGNDALGSLLQMQRLGRLRLLLGYRPEIRYQASLQGITEDELQFYPIRGTGKYLSGYIGCTDTPKGRQAIVEINQVLRTLTRERLDEAYAAWLDPQSRSDYLRDTKAFFDNLMQP